MLQINVRKHNVASTVALRGLMDEGDAPELIDQLELILKFDNKLHLIIDCTRLVNANTAGFDMLYNVLLRLTYLRTIYFCGVNDTVKAALVRSRIKELVDLEGPYQVFLEAIHEKEGASTLEDTPIEIKPIM